MDLNLPNLPSRFSKPRSKGLTVIQDEGLSMKGIEEIISTSGHIIDFVRISSGSICSAEPLRERVDRYRQAGITPLLGGIIFEAAYIRDSVDKYMHLLDTAGIDHIEISDSVVEIPPEKKAGIIEGLSKRFTVFSKTGTKIKTMSFRHKEWKDYIIAESAAGAKKIIIEGGEAGISPVFSGKTEINLSLVNLILKYADVEDIIWETPLQEQQVWFITRFGADVNLADIEPSRATALESHRLGLNWETFRNDVSGLETTGKKLRKTDPIFEIDFQL